MNTEYMNGVIYSSLTYVSEFTFRFMEDSGWYTVDYDYTEPYIWGKGEGCAWFNSFVLCFLSFPFPRAKANKIA